MKIAARAAIFLPNVDKIRIFIKGQLANFVN